jgi:CDP-diacylglycerol---glycerol-3-phosphate 3-phosphatidyltransferase
MNLALKLTVLRVLLAPVFLWVFVCGEAKGLYLWLALLIVLVSEMSDLLDGLIARHYNLITDIGKILDPMADSISRFTIFLGFFCLDYAEVWMILVFFYRDMLVANLRILAASKSEILAARPSGKIKAVTQAIAIFGVLLVLLAQEYGLSLYFESSEIIYCFMLGAVLVTLYSLVDYLYSNRLFITQLV